MLMKSIVINNKNKLLLILVFKNLTISKNQDIQFVKTLNHFSAKNKMKLNKLILYRLLKIIKTNI